MWALIVNGTVAEITELDPTDRFHEALVFIACPPGTGVGDVYEAGVFVRPEIPEVTLVAAALARRDAAMFEATARIAPLQDAVELDMATEAETAQLLAWRQYRVALNRIEQQEDYPRSIEWPQPPE